MQRSHVQDLQQREDGSTVVVSFCAGGKSLKGLADRQPFYWFVDSNMGVNGTTNPWLYAWAKKRLSKGWIFPEYTLRPKQEHVCALWNQPAKQYWLIAGVWNKLLSLEPIRLSEQDRTSAQSTLYSTQSCMLSLAHAMSHHMLGMTVLDRTRLGQWLMKQQGAEVLASLVKLATSVSSSAVSAVSSWAMSS